MRLVLTLFLTIFVFTQDGCVRKNQDISAFHPPYPNCEIVMNGLSPNGQTAFILIPPQPWEGPMVSHLYNCLMTRSSPGKFLQLPSQIQTFSFNREKNGGVVKWAKDSSAVAFFESYSHPERSEVFSRSAYDIYVVPIINGQPGEITHLETEILRVADADAATKAQAGQFKDTPALYVQISDQGMDDDLTFNDANQLVVDCWCTSTLRDSNGSSKGRTTAHVTGLWDPVQGKFVKQSYEPIVAPTTSH